MKKRVKIGILFIGIMCSIWISIQAVIEVDNGQKVESQKLLEDSIHRAIMTCYATEGIYPPTMEYLEENYGILIDEDYYTVFYEVFADNIMPTVTVIPKD